MALHLLYESAAGYAVFEVQAFEEVSTKLKQI